MRSSLLYLCYCVSAQFFFASAPSHPRYNYSRPRHDYMFTLEAGRLPVPSPWGAASQRGAFNSAQMRRGADRKAWCRGRCEKRMGERKVLPLCHNIYFSCFFHHTWLYFSLMGWSADTIQQASDKMVELRFWKQQHIYIYQEINPSHVPCRCERTIEKIILWHECCLLHCLTFAHS